MIIQNYYKYYLSDINKIYITIKYETTGKENKITKIKPIIAKE